LDVKISTLTGTQQEAEITLSNEELQPHFDLAYERFRPKAQMHGFRKGKVPLPMIKKIYGEAIEHDALDTIADETYRKAMEERNIHPLGQPTLADMDFQRGASLRFKIKYEVKPAITLSKYKGIAAEKPIHTVSDEEVERELLHIRRANSNLQVTDAVTDSECVVTADVQEVDAAGTPLIGKKTSAAKFHLYDETLAPEINTVLAHAVPGTTYRVDLQSTHADHTHETHLALTVTKVEKVLLPDLDDALVQKITGGKTTSAEQFRNNLRNDIGRYWEDLGTSRVRDTLADEIVRSHEFPVPDTIVNSYLDSFVEEMKNRSRGGTLPKDFEEKRFREENRANAFWQAKWLLLKEKIAEAEGIVATDEDLERFAADEAERLKIEKEKLLQYYKRAGTVRERILSDKIMTFLLAHAKIREKTIEPDLHATH